MENFLYHSEKSQHFYSKCVKTLVPSRNHVYFTAPSRKFKPLDGCYESYARQASFKNAQCDCYTPTCPATGMNGAYPVGFEVATFVDEHNVFWNMPSRVSILTMQDKDDAFKFFEQAFPYPVQQAVTAASRTAFYTVMSLQLNHITVTSTRSLVHLDLIIFTLFYILDNHLEQDEVFRSYVLSDDAWDILAGFDPIWGVNKGSWLCKFLAYDALNSDDRGMRKHFGRIRLPLLKALSVPFPIHPLAVIVEDNTILYKSELIGSLIMYGDTFWVATPTEEFLSGKALMYLESRHTVIITEEETTRCRRWLGHLDELKLGRWKAVPAHREWALSLDRMVHEYL